MKKILFSYRTATKNKKISMRENNGKFIHGFFISSSLFKMFCHRMRRRTLAKLTLSIADDLSSIIQIRQKEIESYCEGRQVSSMKGIQRIVVR